MKIVASDNFDTACRAEFIICEKIETYWGNKIVHFMNEFGGNYAPYYYKLVEDDYKLYEPDWMKDAENASIQSTSQEIAGVDVVDLSNEQCRSEGDCRAANTEQSSLPQTETRDNNDRPGRSVDLIENTCQYCSKQFTIEFVSCICDECYVQRQGRKRHYMG